MTDNTPAYELKNIQHFYGSKKVLDIPALEIPKGSITGIIGPNGSGKSTFLKILAFINRPSSGQILYRGKPEYPYSQTVRSKVTLLSQKPYLLKRSVFENVIYGLKIRKDSRNFEKQAKNALSAVGLDYTGFAKRKWHELSGGEAQRVALAARLVLKPEVLLLDEPIASVDTESAKLIREAALDARKHLGTTLVIVSHDLSWLYSCSDRQLSIYNGTMFATGIENVISGPFKDFDAQHQAKILPDGQRILLKKQERQGQTAVLKKKHIALDLKEQAKHPDLNQIPGTLTALMLEKKSGFILATIFCRDLSFVLRLTPDQIDRMALYPGKKVVIKFMSTDVEWI